MNEATVSLIERLDKVVSHIQAVDGWSRKDVTAIRTAIAYIKATEMVKEYE